MAAQSTMMAKVVLGTRFTREVIAILDAEEEGGMEDTLFPGSDDEFALADSDSGPEEEETETNKYGYLL